jgi:hypothetical protein
MNNKNRLNDEENKLKINNIENLCKDSRKNYVSPTKYLQEKVCINKITLNRESSHEENHLITINEEKEGEKINSQTNPDNQEQNICYENWIYKITEEYKIKKFYLVLINKDIFYYNSEDKKEFLGMHNLSGCFIQEGGENEKITLEDKSFYIFEIFFNNKSKTRKYYSPNFEIALEFTQNLKKGIGYIQFNDYYEIQNKIIGKGKFGVVNLGIHKKTGNKVAIKIINKSSIKTQEDNQLVRSEIDIMKLCHHPNIVKLLDHFENSEFIFIVMEYIEGGTLNQYLKKKNFNFSERQIAILINQIGNGLKYLHKYGIIHRDLKPDNIMLTEQSDKGIIKIMDFGLSKIAGYNEGLIDGYGTLSYVAPEVLLRIPYNKEVDIWSMGIILYYMLCGKFPFYGPDEEIIAKRICYGDLEFDDENWEIRSKKVIDLIEKVLVKDPSKRISIDEFLNHSWFKKNMKQKMSM